MNRRTLVPIVLASAILAAAACSATTPVIVDDGIVPPSVDPSATATAPAPPVPTARFAVYQLGGSLWFYDVADDEVQRLTQRARVRLPRWIDEDTISFVRDAGGESRSSSLMRVDLRTGDVEELFAVETGIAVYGWSPDRDTVAYVTVDELSFPQIHYRTLSAGATVRTVATLSRQFGRERTDDDQLRVEFSPDGRMVLIAYTYAGGQGPSSPEETQVQVRGSDGSLLFAPNQALSPTMALWAPDGSRLYFRNDEGARAWSPAEDDISAVPSSPFWRDPSIARHGRLIAFDTGQSDPRARIRVINLRTGDVAELSNAGRAWPVFADNRTVWAQRVRACSGDCLVPGELVNQVFAIDTRTGKERALAMRSLADVDVLYA